MKKTTVVLLMSAVLICAMGISPAVAQTTDEILADGRGEAVQVISATAFNTWALIIGALVALAGIVTLTALRLVYRSTPEWAHNAMIAVADKAISTLQTLAEDTAFTDIDDKVASAVREAFDKFVKDLPSIEVNTSADDKT